MENKLARARNVVLRGMLFHLLLNLQPALVEW